MVRLVHRTQPAFVKAAHIFFPGMSSDDQVSGRSSFSRGASLVSDVLDQVFGVVVVVFFLGVTFASSSPVFPYAVCGTMPYIALSPSLNNIPVHSGGDEHRLDVLMKMLACGAQAVSRRCLDKDAYPPWKYIGRQMLFGDGRDQIAPFPPKSFCLAFVVNDGCCKRSCNSKEDQPVSRR